MIAMTVASIILMGVTAAYSALSRAAARLAIAERGLAGPPSPTCRPAEAVDAPIGETSRYRCTLPERCEYDTVSQSCRTTTSR